MTSIILNSEYYRGTFLKIRKFMEVREKDTEVQEETVCKGRLVILLDYSIFFKFWVMDRRRPL